MSEDHGSRIVESSEPSIVAEIGRTAAGSIRIQLRPSPLLRSFLHMERLVAAKIYELAAALERALDEEGGQSVVSPETFNARLDLELLDGDDEEEAAAFVVAVMEQIRF